MGKDLRQALKVLEDHGRLKTVSAPVDRVFEVAGILRRVEGGPAVLFTDVTGSPYPLLGGLTDSREKIALVLGTSARDLLPFTVRALQNPISPVLVERAPCQEIVESEPDLSTLPIPTLSERDGGPYLTGGLHLSHNPENGIRNASMHRNQLKGRDRLGIWMAPTHLFHHYLAAARRGRPLPVAIAIGVHPALLVASQLRLPFDVDELTYAGALLGEPVEMVRCRTIPVEVPAQAEFVLECEILPEVKEPEGPFGEFAGLYGAVRDSWVMRVKAVTHRADAIYHNVMCGMSVENPVLGAVGREPSLYQAVKAAVPTVRDVHMPVAGGRGNFDAVVSIKKVMEGEPQKAGFAAFAAQDLLKFVVVVDDDVDVYNFNEVEYAICTRMRADQDIHVIRGVKTVALDPMGDEYAPARSTVAKMIIDATRPFGQKPETLDQADVPASVKDMVSKKWKVYGL